MDYEEIFNLVNYVVDSEEFIDRNIICFRNILRNSLCECLLFYND